MARIAALVADSRGVYSYLLRHFEADLSAWVVNLSRSHADGERYPRQQILDGLRAGLSVSVPFWDLHETARSSAPKRHVGDVLVMPSRAIVGPDDRITYTDDDWARLFIEENGL